MEIGYVDEGWNFAGYFFLEAGVLEETYITCDRENECFVELYEAVYQEPLDDEGKDNEEGDL